MLVCLYVYVALWVLYMGSAIPLTTMAAPFCYNWFRSPYTEPITLQPMCVYAHGYTHGYAHKYARTPIKAYMHGVYA